MGHERVGSLPRTRSWLAIGELLDQGMASGRGQTLAAEVAARTAEAARRTIPDIQEDEGVTRSFQFLVMLSVAAQQADPRSYLLKQGISLPDEVTPLALSVALRSWISMGVNETNPEYTTLARQATADTIAEWHRKKTTGQSRLLEDGPDQFESWRGASDGRGFSELSRTFFAKFTYRYLNYFLSRIASDKMPTVEQRNTFGRALELHVSDLATHAFETALITQSFAAGWFNKNARQEMPTVTQTKGFLYLAFSKISEELRRESTKR